MGGKAVARIGAPPETHYTLPPEFAAALGQCVANFGWLEEIIKRSIYALDRARLADDLTQEELQTWLEHIGHLADDSMGTLIEQLDAAMRRHPGLRDRDDPRMATMPRVNALRQLENDDNGLLGDLRFSIAFAPRG